MSLWLTICQYFPKQLLHFLFFHLWKNVFSKKPLLPIVHFFFLTWPISSRVCLIFLLFRAETLKVNLLCCQAGIPIGVCGGGGARVYLPRNCLSAASRDNSYTFFQEMQGKRRKGRKEGMLEEGSQLASNFKNYIKSQHYKYVFVPLDGKI